VRQTVSKWEKGLSVPDAELLIKAAEILEVPVSQLLGSQIEAEEEPNVLAEQLSRINEQLVIKNRRAKRVWKALAIIAGGIVVAHILLVVSGVIFSVSLDFSGKADEPQVIEEIVEQD
jgi:transcriptional regulator with XRE-family HTH domain